MTDRTPTTEAHSVYPGGPDCQPNCPGPWSSYHDGYADGYSRGEDEARAPLVAALERIAVSAEDIADLAPFPRKVAKQARAALSREDQP